MPGEPPYFTRKINLVVPLGESVAHFLVVGRDEVGVLAKITGIMAAHRLNLLNGGTYDTLKKDEFLFNVFAEFSGADATPEDVSAELRALPFVSSVVVSLSEDAVYDRYMFPVVLFERNRAVILPADSIAIIENDLHRQIGKRGQNVLFEVGRSSGLSIAGVHRNMIPEADRDTLLKTACDDMRARGWGLVTFEVSRSSPFSANVTVREPIFAGFPAMKTSWWLMGLTSGFLEAIYGHRTVVSGRTSYDEKATELVFQLAEFNPDSRPSRDLV